MPRIRTAAFAFVCSTALVCAASSAFAQDLIEVRANDVVILKSGPVLRGVIVERDDAAKILRIKLADKSLTAPVEYDSIKEILPAQSLADAYAAAKRKLDKADLATRLRLARECAAKRLTKEALADLSELAAEFPAKYEVHHELISLLVSSGDPGAALRAVTAAAAAVGADDPRVLLDKARVLVQLGRGAEALAALEAAGDRPEVRIARGSALLDMGEPEKALALFEEILKDDPKNFDALLGAGMSCLQMARPVEAAKHFSVASAVNKAAAEPLIGLGSALYLERDFEPAAACLKDALNLAPQSSDAYATLGLSELMCGADSSAAERLMEAVRLDASNGRAHVGLAVIFKRLGEADAALDRFRRAAEASPRDAFCRYLYADALLSAGKTAEALAEYKAASAAAPNFPDAVLAVASVAVMEKNYAEAAKWYGKAIAMDAQNPHAHAGLGVALLGQGMIEEANVELRRALLIDKRNTAALLGLAYIANSESREDEALNCLQQVLTLEPDNASAIDWAPRIYRNRGEEMEYVSFADNAFPSGWVHRQSFGVALKVSGGALAFSGAQKTARQGQTVLQREIEASRFLRFSAEVTPVADSQFEGGVFLKCARGYISLARTSSGKAAFTYRDRNGVQPWTELGDWPAGTSLRLQIILLDPEKLEFRCEAGPMQSKPFVVDTFLQAGRYEAGLYTAAELNTAIEMKVDNICAVQRTGGK